jgi:tRNA pseudouridine55 synthase
MDGVLLVDKPAGPTSHDVVRRIRRTSGESRIGHTGTLDPRATGLLALVLGRATRLASRLTAHRKTYEAEIRLGLSTDTDDADGQPLGDPTPVTADAAAVRAAVASFVGAIDQVPPKHSAKKVGGERAYTLARRDEDVQLAPVPVTVFEIETLACTGDQVRLRVTTSPGFYVRALARDLGLALGCGGHLTSLRRTVVGRFHVETALSFDEAERIGPGVADRLVSMSDALQDRPAVRLTERGLLRARHGNAVGAEHLDLQMGALPPPSAGDVRLLGPAGDLVAIAHSRGGALHPVLVVG